MKKIILLAFISLFYSANLLGQQFVSENNQWNVLTTRFMDGKSTEIFKIGQDSVVNSLTYKKILVSSDSMHTAHFRGLVREDSGIVWFIHTDDTLESVLYNFNLKAGDSAYIANGFCYYGTTIPIYVVKVDTAEYFGIQHKRWLITDDFGFEEYWIDGIGSTSGPMYSMFTDAIVGPVFDLLCFHNGDTLMYENENENSCWVVGIEENRQPVALLKPNPVAKGRPFSIETTKEIVDIKLYNTSGKLIEVVKKQSPYSATVNTTPLQAGLYVIRIKVKGIKTDTYKLLIE